MSESMDSIFLRHGADKGSTWHNYSPHYERLFEPMRNEPINLLEIGVQFGLSIKSWLDYFPNAQIVGVDIANDFPFQHERYTFVQGDQSNHLFWKKFEELGKKYNVIVDDAGHYAAAQMVSFQWLWPSVVSGGLYIVEDCWTLPDPRYNQQEAARTFIFWLFSLVNRSGKAYHGEGPGPRVSLEWWDTSIESISIFPGLIILKKK